MCDQPAEFDTLWQPLGREGSQKVVGEGEEFDGAPHTISEYSPEKKGSMELTHTPTGKAAVFGLSVGMFLCRVGFLHLRTLFAFLCWHVPLLPVCLLSCTCLHLQHVCGRLCPRLVRAFHFISTSRKRAEGSGVLQPRLFVSYSFISYFVALLTLGVHFNFSIPFLGKLACDHGNWPLRCWD